jgi:hypothetical protein
MATTPNLQQILQLAISLPIITLIFSDCTSTLALMYIEKNARHSFARDFFFACAAVFIVYTVMKTFIKTMVICTQDITDNSAVTFIHMPVVREANAKASPNPVSTSAPTSAPSKDYKAMPGSPIAAKTPQTPSPANESMGPEEEEKK